jgi:hypothetical protein
LCLLRRCSLASTRTCLFCLSSKTSCGESRASSHTHARARARARTHTHTHTHTPNTTVLSHDPLQKRHTLTHHHHDHNYHPPPLRRAGSTHRHVQLQLTHESWTLSRVLTKQSTRSGLKSAGSKRHQSQVPRLLKTSSVRKIALFTSDFCCWFIFRGENNLLAVHSRRPPPTPAAAVGILCRTHPQPWAFCVAHTRVHKHALPFDRTMPTKRTRAHRHTRSHT